MPERPFVYVCSPFRGDIKTNVCFAREYSRRVFDAGYCPLAPHLLFPRFLDDNDPAQRQAGMEMGLSLLAQCRLLVVCGAAVSEGMEREIEEALRLNIPVIALEELPRIEDNPRCRRSLWERIKAGPDARQQETPETLGHTPEL